MSQSAKLNARWLLIWALFGSGCAAAGPRRLSHEEAHRLGLTGVIHDAPLCPTRFENGISRVIGPCEYVTCQPVTDGGEVECVAIKRRCPPGITCR